MNVQIEAKKSKLGLSPDNTCVCTSAIRGRRMTMTQPLKHHIGRKGALGYEISTGVDLGYQRGTSSLCVSKSNDCINIDVSRSIWPTYDNGKTGRTTTRSAFMTLSRDQAHQLIAVLTEAIAGNFDVD